MTTLVGTLLYLLVGATLVPFPQALLQALVCGGSALGVTRLTHAQDVVAAFAWFRKYPGRGAFVLLLSASLFVLGIANGVSTAMILLNFPLVFFWFWLFAAIGTFLDERRIRRLVARELAERSSSPDRR